MSVFEGLSLGTYRTISADPPWRFQTRSEKRQTRSPSVHYPVMNLDDIKKLPVGLLAAPNCVLLMWTTDPMLRKSFEVLDAWGFEYKTIGFTWAKTDRGNQLTWAPRYFTGMGYWTRANSEMCLLATRGKPKRISASVDRLIVSPRREHSRKPDEFFERVERLVPGPYLELFAREHRGEKWDSWGNEVGKFDTPPAYAFEPAPAAE